MTEFSHDWRRGTRHHNAISGFSLLELVVVIAIIAVLASVLFLRLPAWQARAEMASMESVIGALRSGIGIKVAEYLAREDVSGIHALAGSNPMERLAQQPVNYLGVLADVDPASVQRGHWYFDRRQRTLVYRVRHERYFSGGQRDPVRARFTVSLVYELQTSATRKRSQYVLVGVQLTPLEPYVWFSQQAQVEAAG